MKHTKNILFAMRHQRVCDAAAKMLEGEGYGISTATTLRSALAKMSSDPVQLIVCGLELEDVSGISLLSYLKNDPLRESIPFVFLVHKNNEKDFDAASALSLGAEDYIFVPITAKDFSHKIRKILSPEAITEQQSPEPARMTAMVSINGKKWAAGLIINHTYQGAIVETKLPGKAGNTITLKYRLPEGPVLASGKLLHILLGDQERPMGLGLNFGKDENWRKIHRFLKAPEPTDSPASSANTTRSGLDHNTLVLPDTASKKELTTIDLTTAPFSPVSIEVSRDGALWMPGKIVRFSGEQVSIKTPILAKPGNDIYLKCVLIQGQITVMGAVEELRIDDLKMPAGLEVTIRETQKWIQVYDFLNELKDTLLQQEKEEARQIADQNETPYMETIILTQKPSKKTDFKHRFYESLIGKQMGNYEIVSLLGAGAMGGVFEGWDPALERSVALKVISFELSSKQEFVDMFFKEARYISQLNHPNISHVYYIGKENDILYYAMEFVQGKTLAEIIKHQVRVPAETAISYLLPTCDGLDHVWRKRIIHRDIKPANIMVTNEALIKIVDFGVAQQYRMGVDEIMENMAGSPPYLSPEAIQGHSVDHRSDIYSLGATFYHALSGSPPFLSHTVEGILAQHVSATPMKLKEKHTDIPDLVSDVIEKMLAKSPEDRFQTYQEIINAFE